MSNLRRLFLLFLLGAPLTWAGPVGFDFSGAVTGFTGTLVTKFEPIFKPVGDNIFAALSVIMLISYGGKIITAHNHGEYQHALSAAKHWLMCWLVGWVCMTYYDVPVFGTAYSIHQIIPAAAGWMAHQINLSIMDTLMIHIKDLVQGMPQPGALAPIELLTYALVLLQSIALESILILVSCIGFIGMGIFALFGPLLIPWIQAPQMRSLFYAWIHGSLKYALFLPVAAAQSFVWSSAADSFITSSINGDYSFPHLLGSLVGLGIITIGSIFGLLMTGAFVHDLTTGSSSGGGGGIGIISAIKGIF